MTTKKKSEMKSEVDHVDVPYPSEEQGFHSAQHFVKAALGVEPLSTPEMVNHGWVVAGAGLGVVFPFDGMMQAKVMKLTQEEQEQLRQFTAMQAGDEKQKIDWKAMLRLVLPIILKLLMAVVILVGVSSKAHAQQVDLAKTLNPTFAMRGITQKCLCGDLCDCTFGNHCGCGGKVLTNQSGYRWDVITPKMQRLYRSGQLLGFWNKITGKFYPENNQEPFRYSGVGLIYDESSGRFCSNDSSSIIMQTSSYMQQPTFIPQTTYSNAVSGGTFVSCGPGG